MATDNVIQLRQLAAPPTDELGPDMLETVGQLIRFNYVHLLDSGEHVLLRQMMVEAVEWLKDVPLPEENENG